MLKFKILNLPKMAETGKACVYENIRVPAPAPLGIHCALSFRCFFEMLWTCDNDLFVNRLTVSR